IATRAYFVSMSCLPAKKRLTSELFRFSRQPQLIEISSGAFVYLNLYKCSKPDNLKHPPLFYIFPAAKLIGNLSNSLSLL
ncbi:hypothetical protein, partial [Klebsiella pneumoniae]|uniref:hypothetical protein n=1 Tax=Klebsiella pneumoniae TaxID=573 RepID=UPI0028FCC63B